MRGHEYAQLLTAAAAGATGDPHILTGGGRMMALCHGTGLDGSHTANIEALMSSGDWVNVYSFTANGATVVDLAPGQYRGTTTATAPTGTTLEMGRIPTD